ncbi:MAG: magnetosome protein MamS [Rhodospirillales bacterium]
MKAEHWIVSAGMVFSFGVIGAAMVPGFFEDGAIPTQAVATAPGNPDARLAVQGAIQGAAQAPEANAMIPGLVPFSRATSERFQGKVVRMVSWGNDTGWGQIHIWVDNGSGPSREVSVAPDWYLKHLGCRIEENSRVRGVAFKFGKARPDAELYAKGITVDGKSCRLRNDEGFALWSNRLR